MQGPAIAGDRPVYFEPVLTTEFLPRCARCGDRHPAAYQPPRRREDGCPTCGAATPMSSVVVEVPAVITGWTPSALRARFCFKAAAFLHRLERSLRP